MKGVFSKLKPDSLAARFVLLLAGALIAANVVAFLVLASEGRRFDRVAQDAREVERAIGLVEALQSIEPALWRAITTSASSRFTQAKVEDAPVVSHTGTEPRALDVANAIMAQLPDQIVLVAELPPFAVKRPKEHAERGRRTGALVVSIQLDTAGRKDKWLNIISYEAARNAGIGLQVLLTTLVLSLVAVLGVGLIFVRQLVRPLSALASAAEAAGRGDRSATVPVEGAREFRAAGEAFNDMQAKIAGFDAERMRTLGAVGHDLRTPITGLRIRAEMLEDIETRNAFVRTLDDMTVMADGLVTFAKGTREAEEPAEFQLNPFLLQLCQTRGAVFVSGAQANINIVARPVSLGRAIGNLIDNGLRYAGQVMVRVETKWPDVRILVEDDGPGIAPEKLDAMFEPFVRGEESRNQETGGAGLGLSIARSIIEAHGGTITLENLVPKGLRAVITLPLQKRT